MIDDSDLDNHLRRIKDGAPALKKEEAVDHPAHYCYGKHEVIDIIEDWNLGYHLGNAVKYIARCERKGKKIEDLKKAIWYLQREIDKEEKLKNT